MINIIFDQYQRYKNAQIIVDKIRKSNEKFKILEVGANEHRNLEKFLPNDDVTYLDINLPENLLNDNKYILGDATDMKFEDNYYDIVIALDVYEHIPKERRENFIKEIYRVSKYIAIISAPFDNDQVVFAERRANEYYKSLIGLNHLWLNEHIVNGLPNRHKLEEYLKRNNINFVEFSHGNLNVWEKLTDLRALLEIDKGLSDYIFQIDEYYNKFMFSLDYDEDGYRNFVTLLKGRQFEIDPCIKKGSNNITLNNLIENAYRLFEIRKSMGILTEKLPLYGHNILTLYFDYGNGYDLKDSSYVLKNLYIEEHYLFNCDMGRKLKSIRLDPSELPGKIVLKDIVIKDNNNNVISDVRITSNCALSNENEFLFKRRDPQIILSFEESRVSSIEFTLRKIDGDDYEECIISDVIEKKIDAMGNKIKEEINKSFFLKVKNKIRSKNF